MLAIYRRELRAYFNSALAWVLMAIYLLVLGLVFNAVVEQYANYSMRAQMSPMGGSVNVVTGLLLPVMWWMGFLMLFMLPLLTMRLLAEERHSGTLELLFSYPLKDYQIIGGKFMAAMTVVVVTLAFSSICLFMLAHAMTLPWRLIGVGYLGLVLLGAAFVSFGLWASSITESQMIGALIAFGGSVAAWLSEAFRDDLGKLTHTFGSLSVMSHLENLVKGMLNTQDLVYYVAWTALFLFLTARVLESRKWST